MLVTVTTRPASAAESLALVEAMAATGLTPVMRGTRFSRHSFKASQFGSYVEYLDERGTAGRCEPKNLLRAFEFVDFEASAEPQGIGYAVVVADVPCEPATLLEAAACAVVAMDAAGVGGAARDDLARAIVSERRMH